MQNPTLQSDRMENWLDLWIRHIDMSVDQISSQHHFQNQHTDARSIGHRDRTID